MVTGITERSNVVEGLPHSIVSVDDTDDLKDLTRSPRERLRFPGLSPR